VHLTQHIRTANVADGGELMKPSSKKRQQPTIARPAPHPFGPRAVLSHEDRGSYDNLLAQAKAGFSRLT